MISGTPRETIVFDSLSSKLCSVLLLEQCIESPNLWNRIVIQCLQPMILFTLHIPMTEPVGVPRPIFWQSMKGSLHVILHFGLVTPKTDQFNEYRLPQNAVVAIFR